jgi:hypothetical protein
MSDPNDSNPRPLVVRDGWVTVGDLAEWLGLDKSNVLKALKKEGIERAFRQSSEARGQQVAVVSRADTERFIAQRQANRLGAGGRIEYIYPTGPQEV